MKEAKKIAKSTSLFYLQFIGNLLINAISVIIIPRIIGPFEYGLVTVTNSLYKAGTSFFDFGMSTALPRFVAKYRGEGDYAGLKTAVLSSFVIKYIGSILFGVVLLLSADYIANNIFAKPEIEIMLRIIALAAFFQPIIIMISMVFYGYQEISKHIFLNILTLAASTVLSILLVIFGYGAKGVIIGGVAGAIMVTPVAIIIFRKKLREIIKIKADLSTTKIKEIINFGLFLTISNSSFIIYMQMDKIVLALYTTSAEVGYYGLAFMVATVIEGIALPLSSAMLPVVSELKGKKDDMNINKMFMLSSKYLTIYSVLVVSLAIPLANPIFRLVFPQFTPSIPLFQILIVGIAFRVIIYPLVTIVEGIGRVDLSAKLRVITAGVSIAFLFVLISRFGLIGAPIAFASNALIYLILSLSIYTKVLKLTFLYKEAAIIAICGIISLGTGMLLANIVDQIILKICLIMLLVPLILASLLWITKAITKEDLKFIKLMKP